ncbi:ABC transporter substrate-binding protein [Allobacillus sp. GCM10007491]|uniref:Cobalamin-binding protein n=1 Tax=Allobacillus saliphilus TaxID=2912308 RepID=A0A941HSJ4_9BACI|nr:cobalamin-binding protein [Allobacillus saliphilus]MBR7553027.1 cobalamin-binding protein [Allobacillus saliphilus]
MRIVSICPSNTEIMAYLDLMNLVVGVDDDSDWPEAVNDLPKVGRDLSVDMDAVEQLQPDLVLASLSVPGMEKNIEGLKERNLPYVILNPNSLDEIGEDILTVGKLTGYEDRANRVYNEYHETINYYREKSLEVPVKKRIYWEWWPKPIFTPGRKNWLSYISELAGAENVFSTYADASIQVEWEEVLEKDPDDICMVWVGVQEAKMNPKIIKKREGADQLQAVQQDRIHVLEEHLYCRPSPRLLEGLKKLAPILHPDIFNRK